MNIGIIGTNFISDEFVDAAKRVGGYQLHSVYSRKEETGQYFANRHGISHVYTDMEAFLSDPELEAVYIASPNSFHCRQALSAMNHGKHALVEKPIASNLTELARMEAAARENGVVLMEAMRPAYLPGYDWVRANLKRLGTIRSAEFHFCQYSRRYDRFKDGEILNAFDPSLSNAAVMDIGVYVLHTFLMLFGRPDRTQASSIKLSNGMEGGGAALLTYPDMTASLRWSKISDDPEPSRILGENGYMTLDRLSRLEHVTLSLRNGEKEEFVDESTDNNMIYELDHFKKLVKKISLQPSAGQPDMPSCVIENIPIIDDPLVTTRLCLEVMDDIRRQTGVVFPADHQI